MLITVTQTQMLEHVFLLSTEPQWAEWLMLQADSVVSTEEAAEKNSGCYPGWRLQSANPHGIDLFKSCSFWHTDWSVLISSLVIKGPIHPFWLSLQLLLTVTNWRNNLLNHKPHCVHSTKKFHRHFGLYSAFLQVIAKFMFSTLSPYSSLIFSLQKIKSFFLLPCVALCPHTEFVTRRGIRMLKKLRKSSCFPFNQYSSGVLTQHHVYFTAMLEISNVQSWYQAHIKTKLAC